MSKNLVQEVLDTIRRHRRFLLVMHATPDGDSAGSALALGSALKRQGCDVTWVSPDGIAPRLAFLPSSDCVQSWSQVDAGHFDCVVTLDCGSDTRLGAPTTFWQTLSTLINIDHHPNNPQFGTLNWVDADASSTGELVTRLWQRAGWPMNSDEAVCLYTAISTDTLSFRQQNADARCLSAVQWLVDSSGLDIASANQKIWASRPIGELKLLGWALSSIELSPDGRYAWVGIPRHIMDRFHVDDSGVDTVVHHLVTIQGVEVGFLVREADQAGKMKVSWRSRPPWDCGQLAAEFGGGGHRYAAAAQVDGSLDDTIQMVKQALMGRGHA